VESHDGGLAGEVVVQLVVADPVELRSVRRHWQRASIECEDSQDTRGRLCKLGNHV